MLDRSMLLGGLLLFVLAVNFLLKSRRKISDPPPAPERLPSVLPWKKYYEWYKSTGHPVMSLSLPGSRKVLLVSGLEALQTLYTTRSSTYSTRPLWRMAHLIGRENNVAFTPYGNRLKTARKFLISSLGQKQIPK